MNFRSKILIAAMFIAVGLVLNVAYAKDVNKVGEISKLEGNVELKSKWELVFKPALANSSLFAGDTIRTKSDGWVEVKFDNGNIITLQEDSNLLIEKYVQDLKKDAYENILNINLGKMRAKVEKLKEGSLFEIQTPTAVAAARGTIIFIEANSELSRLLVDDGVVEFSNKISGKQVIVKSKQASSAYRDGVITDPCIPTPRHKKGSIAGFDR